MHGRWYTQSQAVELLPSAWFVDVELFHGFTPEAVHPDDRVVWFTTRRPGSSC